MINKMREVAEVLGVPFTEDIDEPKCFEVCFDRIWHLAFICERGLAWVKATNGTFNMTVLAGILSGNIEYRIIPFPPKLGKNIGAFNFAVQVTTKTFMLMNLLIVGTLLITKT